MSDRYINLKELLPLYLQEYKELAEIMDTETPELRLLESRHNQLVNNRYISTCDEDGIARYEKILGITPKSDDTLGSRKARVLLKWNDAVPYNFEYLKRQLNAICGEDHYEICMDFDKQQLTLKVSVSVKGVLGVMDELLYFILPANIAYFIENKIECSVKGIAYITNGIVITQKSISVCTKQTSDYKLNATAYASGNVTRHVARIIS